MRKARRTAAYDVATWATSSLANTTNYTHKLNIDELTNGQANQVEAIDRSVRGCNGRNPDQPFTNLIQVVPRDSPFIACRHVEQNC